MDTEIALMAESNDGVSWTPAAMGGRCAQLPEVSNCVMVDGHEEFSVVFDDALHSPPSERLKLLFFGNCSTYVSSDGDEWRPFGRWTASTIDGAWVHRNPLRPEEIVVTGRPQSLRHEQGRHAGYHAAVGWAALAHGNISRALPLDELYTPSDQIYGLPSFDVSPSSERWCHAFVVSLTRKWAVRRDGCDALLAIPMPRHKLQVFHRRLRLFVSRFLLQLSELDRLRTV